MVGKSTHELDAMSFAAIRARHSGLVLDIGTGDGKHVLALARARPAALVIGLDAGPGAMRETAGKASRKAAKGGVANAMFVWASVEQLPPELDGVTEVHSLMPWGSLLRALLAPDAAVLRAIAGVCVPAAPFLITLNLHAWRPPVPEVGVSSEPTPASVSGGLAAAYADAGWQLESAGYLDDAQLRELGTSWTKRLGSSRDELAVLALRGHIG